MAGGWDGLVGNLSFVMTYKFAEDVVLPLLSHEAQLIYRWMLRYRYNDPSDPERFGTAVMSTSEICNGKFRNGSRISFGTGLSRKKAQFATKELIAVGLVANLKRQRLASNAKWFIQAIDESFDYADFLSRLSAYQMDVLGKEKENLRAARKEFASLLRMNGELSKYIDGFLRHLQNESPGEYAEYTDVSVYTGFFTFLKNAGIPVPDEITLGGKNPLRSTIGGSDKSEDFSGEKSIAISTTSGSAVLGGTNPRKIGKEGKKKLRSYSLESLFKSIDRLGVSESLKLQLRATTHAALGNDVDPEHVLRIVAASSKHGEGFVMDALDACANRSIFTVPFFLYAIRQAEHRAGSTKISAGRRSVTNDTPLDMPQSSASDAPLLRAKHGDYESLHKVLVALPIPQFLAFGRFTRSEWPSGEEKHGMKREGVWATMWDAMLDSKAAWLEYAREQGRKGVNAYQEIDSSWPYTMLFAPGKGNEWADEEQDEAVQRFEIDFGEALAETWSA